MKTRETKQRDLVALTESLQKSRSAMVVSFTKLSVNKDIEFRNSLRQAGAEFRVVKNTLARIAVKGTEFEQASESFKGVTAIAWTENDPVILSKAVSKFMKDNTEVYSFKTGVVEGRLVDLTQLTTIANLPSKEELISKILFVLNAQAQRIVTVINAVPRDLAVVIKQIGEKAPAKAASAADQKAAEAAPEPSVEATPAEAAATESAAPAADSAAEVSTEAQEVAKSQEIPSPAAEAPASESVEETNSQEIPASGENTPAADASGDAQAEKAE